MGSPRGAYRRLPNSVRKQLALRPQRRWLRATAYRRWHNERVGREAPAVNFHPMSPEPRMQVAWMLRALRIRIGSKPVQGEPNVAWDTGTWFDQRALKSLPDGAINGWCTDVSKSHVDALWASVVGYSITVDPAGNVGPMIVKSEENGAHDGRLVSGSMARRDGYVYQRFIDTRSDGWLHSTRPVIIGREIVVALEFRRTEGDLFFGTNHCVARTPEEVYSRVEHDQLLAFADRIGLEFGELDVFRDRDSKLIYVIDANRTSFRPAHIGRADFVRLYSAAVPALARLLKERGG